MERRSRIEAAMARSQYKSQAKLAEACDVSQPAISELLKGIWEGADLLKKVAEVTGVSYEWLAFGDDDHRPKWATDYTFTSIREMQQRAKAAKSPAPVLSLVGSVKAGDGEVGDYVTESTPFPLRPSWQVVKVEGMSAYPVVYPDQFVMVDLSRATSPDVMEEKHAIDIDDNIVLIQVDGENGGHKAYLKRFCYAPESPDRFVLASIDSGRGSPYIHPSKIFLIAPVVGVIFEDPTKPRKKRWARKTVTVTVKE